MTTVDFLIVIFWFKQHAGNEVEVQPLPRFNFYERTEEAYAIVQCGGERRPYGNFVIKKGVVGPDGKDLKP